MLANKRRVLIVSAAAAAFLAAVLIYVHFTDLSSYRPRVESAASRALGMEVKVDGDMDLDLLPRVGVSLEDIRIKDGGEDFASAKEVSVGISLAPLMKGEVRLTEFMLKSPVIIIEKDPEGKLNILKGGQKPPPQGKGFSLPGAQRITIENGILLYRDKASGDTAGINGLDLTIRDLSFGEDGLGNLSFEGSLKAKEVKAKHPLLSNVEASLKAEDGVILASPLSADVFGSKGTGSIEAAVAGKTPEYRLRFAVPELSLWGVAKAFSEKKIVEGEVNVSLDLTMKGKGPDELRGSLTGNILAEGADITFFTFDLDEFLSEYDKTRRFNLVDVGAYFLAGPFGPAVTKGLDFATAYKETLVGQGNIRRLFVDLKLSGGVADAEDVAFSTRRNRVAAKGGLDLATGRYRDLTVAVLDREGCAAIRQKVSGPFHQPELGKVSFIGSLTAPVVDVLKKTKKIITFQRKCEVFYSGSVEHPE